MGYIKLKLSNDCYYVCYDAINDDAYDLASFLLTDVGCPAYSWDEWIFDNDDESATADITYLEKRDGYIYVRCLFADDDDDNVKSKYAWQQELTPEELSTKLKISAQSLSKLIHDWQEKVCKKKPKNVMITYEDDVFTINTSD